MAKAIIVVTKETFGWAEIVLCIIQRMMIGTILTKAGENSFMMAVKIANMREKIIERDIWEIFSV